MITNRVAAIVPALNEEDNVANVLRVLLKSKYIDEIILVDDGSTDRTAEIGREMGVKVISLPKRGGSGKANAMNEGVKNTDAEIIVFFDADLKNLSPEHVLSLVEPVLKKEAAMCVGIRERRGAGKIAEFLIKLDPLTAVAGERAMERRVFEGIPMNLVKGFMIETALNYYCLVNKLKVRYVRLKGLSITIKEKKWGVLKGFLNRLKMFLELLKARFIILRRKKDFKINQNNVSQNNS